MTASPTPLFWDSCVFTAWLRDEHAAYDIPSIDQYLDEAKAGKFQIHTSMIASAEVLPSQIIKPIGSFEDFLEDFSGAVVVTAPDQNIMQLSGRLRDLPYRKGTAHRRLSTGDAIMLATAVHLRDAWDVPIEIFHTYDKGGKKDIEGNNSVPLIGYETWCEGFSAPQMALAKRVIDLDRKKPIHPTPTLPNLQGGKDAEKKPA